MGWLRGGRPIVGPLLLAALLGACAQAADFKTPIDAFAAATAASNVVVDDFADAADQSRHEEKLMAAATDAAAVEILDGDCDSASTRCRLVYHRPDGGFEPLVGGAATETIRAINDGLLTYATNLQQIASAGDQAAIAAGVEKVKQSAESLLGTVGTVLAAHQVNSTAPARAAQFVEPAAGLASFVIGNVLERKKLQELRAATATLQPHMEDIVTLFELLGRDARGDAVLAKHTAFNDARRAFTLEHSRANLDATMRAAQQLDDVLKADPAVVVRAMAEAHEALWHALRDSGLNSAALTVRLERLVAEATRFKAIVDGFRAAMASG